MLCKPWAPCPSWTRAEPADSSRHETVCYTDTNHVILVLPRCDMLNIHIYLNSDANRTISYCVHCASMNSRTRWTGRRSFQDKACLPDLMLDIYTEEHGAKWDVCFTYKCLRQHSDKIMQNCLTSNYLNRCCCSYKIRHLKRKGLTIRCNN